MNTIPTFEIRRPRFQLPLVAGTIERRILVNFRCRPDTLANILPAPFLPKAGKRLGNGRHLPDSPGRNPPRLPAGRGRAPVRKRRPAPSSRMGRPGGVE